MTLSQTAQTEAPQIETPPAEPAALRPVEGPSAWRGDELAGRTDWIYRLGHEEIAELEAAGRRFLTEDPDLRTVTAADYPLPVTAAGIARWGADMDRGRGFVLVRGLPTDFYSDALSASIFFLLGLHLGEPMKQNELGDVFDHILATSDKTLADPTAIGSRTRDRLNYHSDSSDVVSLMCLRPAKAGGASSLVSGAQLYNEVLARRPDLAALMFGPWHYDWRRQDHDAPRPYYTSPMCCLVDGVFSMYAGARIIRTAQAYPETPRLTPQQLELLDLLDALCVSPGLALDMDMQPGDMQWLLNYAALHSRTAFVDHPEQGRRRHLVRLWLKRDAHRPLPERFGRHVVKSRVEFRDGAGGQGRYHISEACLPRVLWEAA